MLSHVGQSGYPPGGRFIAANYKADVASHPRGRIDISNHLSTLAVTYSQNLGRFSRSCDIAPFGIVKMAPSDADARRESPH